MGLNVTTFRGGQINTGGHVGLNTLVSLADHKNPIAEMRSFSPLPRDAQEILDGEILRVGRDGLVLANDLLDSNLTRAVPNWLSFTTFTAQRASEAGRAKIGMTPNTRGERALPDLAEYSTPMACIWEDWEFDPRTLATAARNGYAIDTTMAEQATRNVNEMIEYITINGHVDANGDPILVYGLPIYGLLNAPNATPYAYTGGEAWDAAGKDGSEIQADIINMMKLGKAAKYPGPWTLYIPTSYGFKLSGEYTANYPKTILSRLLEIPNLAGIKVVDALPDNKVILLQKTRNVFDFLVGMLPTNFSWATNPGMPYSGVSSMVAAVVVPRPKFDYNEQTGIVLGDTT